MATRPPRGVVVSELFLKNETILTTTHASRTTKPWCTLAQLGPIVLRHQRLWWDVVSFAAGMFHFN